jgi:hypothetical protein
MARLTLLPPFTGTRKTVCVYAWQGVYYIRAKSTLSGERVKSAPEFQRTREHASVLASASRIASEVYRSLKEKKFQQYRALTGQAMKLLKRGMQESEVKETLLQGMRIN